MDGQPFVFEDYDRDELEADGEVMYALNPAQVLLQAPRKASFMGLCQNFIRL